MSRERIRVARVQGGFRIQEIVMPSGFYIDWPGLFETASAAWLTVLKSGVKY